MKVSAAGRETDGESLRAITTIYLVLPCLLFVSGWLRLPFALVGGLVLAGVVAVAGQDLWRAACPPRCSTRNRTPFARRSVWYGGCVCLVLLAWLSLSGAGGIGYQNSDYRASNAILKDLMTRDWPLRSTLEGQPTHIVYYVGYYLPAALVGKWAGWGAANGFLFAWTVLGVALAFAWFRRISRVDEAVSKNRVLWLAVLFCLSGGLDGVGYFLLKRNALDPTAHLEWWAVYFQYSSHTALLFWVPQHALAAWLLAGMVVDALLTAPHPKYLGMAVAASMIWSPFGVAGIAFYLPLLLAVYLRPPRRALLLRPASVILNLLSLGMASVLVLYLRANQFAFPMGLIWQVVEKRFSLLVHLLAFWGLEFGVLAALIVLLLARNAKACRARLTAGRAGRWRTLVHVLERELQIAPAQLGLFLFALAVLLLLPLFSLGYGNDFVMRASIPSLFLFWACVAKVLLDTSRPARRRAGVVYALIVLVVAVGFFPAGTEILRSVRGYRLGPPPLAAVPTTENANVDKIVRQRMGREDSVFFAYLGR